jgi:hypothetical protein
VPLAHRCSLHSASLPVLLTPRWCSGGGDDEGVVAVVSKRSRLGGGNGGEGVPTWQRRWGPGGSSVHSSRFLDGSPTVVACEGNENWEVIQVKRWVLNLYSKVSIAVLHGTTVEACVSTTVHR